MIYFGLYDGAVRRLDGPLLPALADAAKRLPATLQFAASAAAPPFSRRPRHGMAPQIAAKLPELQPSAQLRPADTRPAASGETSPTLRPLYLRPPDAKPQAHDAAARR